MKFKRIIYLTLIIIWMVTIFCFSHQNAELSSKTSRGTIRNIINILPKLKNLTKLEKDNLEEFLQPIVRKLAHFSIYTLRWNSFNIICEYI